LYISPPVEGVSLEAVRDAIAGVAGRLDARFVEAGNALARAYEIVEQLIGSLESVTGALDRDAGDAAVASMRAVAERLTRLPALQAERRSAMVTIGEVSRALRGQTAQVRRTLAFLRIAGLNIAVAAAGAAEFAGFADAMTGKLDASEAQISRFEREMDELAAGISGMKLSDALVASECEKVIPAVPLQLAENALALQRHQSDLAELATAIADVARRIRLKVATALGAIQIGDITRQRLEHVCDAVAMIVGLEAPDGEADPAMATVHRRHLLALLADQAADALDAFSRESRVLSESLHGIGPEAGELIELKDAGPAKAQAEGENPLRLLEQSIGQVQEVTQRLREADARSDSLSSATTATAESLTQRLRTVQRVKNDVHQMAWNTDFRCHRMGPEGGALRMVAAEIRVFANKLETLTFSMSETFDTLAGAASSMRGLAEDESRVDAGGALAASLSCVREGAARMNEGLSGLDGHASAVAEILRRTTAEVDCESEIATLSAACGHLAGHAAREDSATEAVRDLLDRIASLYTMARERELHRLFAGEAGPEAAAAAAGAAEDEEDFDDGLF
jgi:hypothetical protein